MGGALGASELLRKSSTIIETLLQLNYRFTGIEAMLDCGHDGGYPSVHTRCLV